MNDHWRRKPFDEVFEDVSGGNVKILQSTYLSQGEYPIVDQGKTLVAGFTNDAKALCKTPSPVIVFGDHTRTLKFIDFSFCMGADGVKVLKPKDGNDPKYLFHYLQHIDIPSAGYDRHFKYLKRLQIASPPLDQQRRIAAILDQAEALLTKRRQVVAKLGILTQALFLERFGNLLIQPSKVRLDELIATGDRICYGVVQPGGEYPGGIHLVRAGDLQLGTIQASGLKTINPAIESTYRRSRLRGYELLICCVGYSIGTTAIADETTRGFNIARAVARIPFDVKRVRGLFLLHYLRTAQMQRYIMAETRTVAQPTLNIKQLSEAAINLPDIAEQDRFVASALAISRYVESSEMSMKRMDALFTSLQHRAFRGEL
jgi:type I restriction enzyme S subunit